MSARLQSQARSQSCSSLHPAFVGDDINAGASIYCIHFAFCKHSWGLLMKCCMHLAMYIPTRDNKQSTQDRPELSQAHR